MPVVSKLPVKQRSDFFPIQDLTRNIRLQSSYGHGEGNITFYAH